MEQAEKNDSSTDEVAVRSQANKRSWLCPGCGFALIGRRPLAVVTFGANLAVVLAVIWLGIQPGGPSGVATLLLIVVASLLWTAEQIAVRKWALRAAGPQILASGLAVPIGAFWMAVVVGAGVFLTCFGSFQMSGGGMSPTFEPGEVMIYHKHGSHSDLPAGQLVIYRNADSSTWGVPGTLVVSRILAGPGDELSIDDGGYLVNGVRGQEEASVGSLPVVVHVPSAPEVIKVPPGCYFVVQDKPTRSFDSRVLSWIPEENVVGSRFWYLGGRGIFKPVE